MTEATFLVDAGHIGTDYIAQYIGPDGSIVCQANSLDTLLLRVIDACRVHFEADAQPTVIAFKFKLNPPG